MEQVVWAMRDHDVRFIDVLVPPLMLLKPNKRKKKGQEHDHHGETTGRSVGGAVLTLAMLALTLFRFSASYELTVPQRNGFVPFLMFSMEMHMEALTYVFWYFTFVALVAVSYPDRPRASRRSKLMVPEVMTLFVLCLSDAVLVLVADHDENRKGQLELKFGMRFQSLAFEEFAYCLLDDLPRLWFMMCLALLLSATITGNISPRAGTKRGAVFDSLWSLLVCQTTAMMLQRSTTRTKVVQSMLKHNFVLAATCGLSVLFFTHSLAMALAVVFRQHEHEHGVPTVGQVMKLLYQKRAPQRIAKVLSFVLFVFWFNSHLKPGMMHHPGEELLIAAMNVIALWVFASVTATPCTQKPSQSWEASLIILVGSLGSFCWWSELFGPDTLERDDSKWRRGIVMLGAVTHICLTALFADVFRHRADPSANQCLFFTFWACTMLFMGAKLEHHSAIEHMRHHRNSLTVWEILEHLGEFGVCEFGLISTMGWVTHLAQNAHRWWHDVDISGFMSPMPSMTSTFSTASLHMPLLVDSQAEGA